MILISAALDWRINVSPFNQGPGEIRGLFLLYNTGKADHPPLAEGKKRALIGREKEAAGRPRGRVLDAGSFFVSGSTKTAHRAK